MFSDIIDIVKELLGMFVNSNTRIFIPYLISSLLIAIIFYYFKVYKKSNGKINIIKFLFPMEIIKHKSAKQDYLIFIIYNLLRIFILVPLVFSGISFAIFIQDSFISWFGFIDTSFLTIGYIIILYTVILLLFHDFTKFVVHYLAHRIPFLWEFHKVHHSAEVMTPITQYRTHPVEQLLFFINGAFSFGLITGIFLYLFPENFTYYSILGVNIGRFFFLFLGANLRHSHLYLSYGKFLEYIFISPAQHQIHHSNSNKLMHKNMGSQFAIWDYMFGTLKLAKDVNRKSINFGLGIEDDTLKSNIRNLYFLPFRNFIDRLKLHSK